jgi:hypothetical protein
MELVEAGESPAAFGLRVMRDEAQPLEVRLNAARLVAPLVHPRPSPAGETVTVSLPEAKKPEDILEASGAIMKAVAEGEMSVNTGRDLMAMLDSHRQCIELVGVDERLRVLEIRWLPPQG